jgi:hypothetical protein
LTRGATAPALGARTRGLGWPCRWARPRSVDMAVYYSRGGGSPKLRRGAMSPRPRTPGPRFPSSSRWPPRDPARTARAEGRPPIRFPDKVAFVTGAGSGTGHRPPARHPRRRRDRGGSPRGQARQKVVEGITAAGGRGMPICSGRRGRGTAGRGVRRAARSGVIRLPKAVAARSSGEPGFRGRDHSGLPDPSSSPHRKRCHRIDRTHHPDFRRP